MLEAGGAICFEAEGVPFNPKDVADEDARYRLRESRVVKAGANTNLAFKIDDKTAVRKSLQINGASYGRNKY